MYLDTYSRHYSSLLSKAGAEAATAPVLPKARESSLPLSLSLGRLQRGCIIDKSSPGQETAQIKVPPCQRRICSYVPR